MFCRSLFVLLYFLVQLDQRSRWTIAITCKLFTFQASSPKPLGQLEPNLAGMFLGWSSTQFPFFVPIGYSTWLPGPIICSDWLKFQRFSSLKLMNDWTQTVIEWSLECPLPSFCVLCRSEIQDGRHRRTKINIGPYGKMFKVPSFQKLQIWLKPNCTWMFIRWSSTNFRFFVPIWNSKWRLWQDLV